jgi:anti-sigma factor RsiW
MNNVTCIYPDREAVLVAYLYDDIDAADRVAFETHVTTCPPCRSELAELRGVRATLGQWASPEPARTSFVNFASRIPNPQSRWYSIPVWAQVAAAMLVLGVSAAIANLDVRYDRAGLNIRTGWSTPARQVAQTPVNPVDNIAPWRAELTALQAELRTELRAQQAASVAAASSAPAGAMPDGEFRRRVRVLLDESEKRQQSELALHMVQLQTDLNAQLQAQASRVSQNFRDVTSTYGDQILKQQRQINYLLPASQR